MFVPPTSTPRLITRSLSSLSGGPSPHHTETGVSLTFALCRRFDAGHGRRHRGSGCATPRCRRRRRAARGFDGPLHAAPGPPRRAVPGRDRGAAPTGVGTLIGERTVVLRGQPVVEALISGRRPGRPGRLRGRARRPRLPAMLVAYGGLAAQIVTAVRAGGRAAWASSPPRPAAARGQWSAAEIDLGRARRGAGRRDRAGAGAMTAAPDARPRRARSSTGSGPEPQPAAPGHPARRDDRSRRRARVVDCRDGMDGALRAPAASRRRCATLELGANHPLTGPVAVRGAQPGDVLVVELLAHGRATRSASTAVIPGFGLLGDRSPSRCSCAGDIADGVARSPNCPAWRSPGARSSARSRSRPPRELLARAAAREAALGAALRLPPHAQGAVPARRDRPARACARSRRARTAATSTSASSPSAAGCMLPVHVAGRAAVARRRRISRRATASVRDGDRGRRDGARVRVTLRGAGEPALRQRYARLRAPRGAAPGAAAVDRDDGDPGRPTTARTPTWTSAGGAQRAVGARRLDRRRARPDARAAPTCWRASPRTCASARRQRPQPARVGRAAARRLRVSRQPGRPAPPTAAPASAVVAVPPRSRVRLGRVGDGRLHGGLSSAAPASASPRKSSSIAPDQISATGLAMPRPAMSGAEPWIAWKRLGWRRVGSRLALGAMPRLPGDRGAEIGEDVAEQVAGHHDVEGGGIARPSARRGRRRGSGRVVMCGNSAATSSNDVVPQRHPVAQRVGLRRARHVPAAVLARVLERVADDPLDAVAGEHGGLDGELGRVPAVDAPAGAARTRPRCSRARRRCRRPRAATPASGLCTPRSSRAGRRLTYWSKTWRRVRISPHTVTVSGTRGSPDRAERGSRRSRRAARARRRASPRPRRGSAPSPSRSDRQSSASRRRPRRRLEARDGLGDDLGADAVAGDDGDAMFAHGRIVDG